MNVTESPGDQFFQQQDVFFVTSLKVDYQPISFHPPSSNILQYSWSREWSVHQGQNAEIFNFQVGLKDSG
jgi:hypothetical protein